MLRHDVGMETDIPAPDVNTGQQEMAWMLDAWRVASGEFQRGAVTGKPIDLGGSMGRRGFGAAVGAASFTNCRNRR